MTVGVTLNRGTLAGGTAGTGGTGGATPNGGVTSSAGVVLLTGGVTLTDGVVDIGAPVGLDGVTPNSGGAVDDGEDGVAAPGSGVEPIGA